MHGIVNSTNHSVLSYNTVLFLHRWNAWSIAQTTLAKNPGCDLVQNGPTIRVVSGAWPFLVDYDSKCTSFLNDVFSNFFLQLRDSGMIENLWQKYIDMYSDNFCSRSAAHTSDASNNTLDILDVVGIFIIYACFVFVSFMFYVYERCLRYFGIQNPWKCFYYRTKESISTEDVSGKKKRRRSRYSAGISSESELCDDDIIVSSDRDPCWTDNDCYDVDLKEIKDDMKKMSVDVARLCVEVTKLQKVQKIEKISDEVYERVSRGETFEI